ncbi:MAG: hypothetical protein J6V25_12845 [Oscillospiraceae bacterium]|nr:hypothetical protein [Oscillospiraceae bacterium]
MKKFEDKILPALWYVLAFGFLYIWFSRIHPLQVYDADDWTYLANIRSALPIWGDWNPAKVFPEMVMPAVSSVAYYGLMPLIGDYLRTFTVVHAAVVSGFITLYLWCFSGMLKRNWNLNSVSRVLFSALFLLFHFLVFRSKDIANLYMFHCVDLNCYYNYLIPGLMAGSAVMFMVGNPDFEEFARRGSPEKRGIALVFFYLTIFSNLTTSGIVAAFAGSVLLLRLLMSWKRFRLKEYVVSNGVYLMIMVLWVVSAVFELSGGRASNSGQSSLFKRLADTAYLLKEVILQCNPAFWATVIGIVVLAVVYFIREKGSGTEEKKFLEDLKFLFVAAAALLVYMVLLCAVVDPGYMLRSEYLFGLFFYGFVLVFVAAAYVAKRCPGFMMVLPLLLLVLISQVNTSGRTFQESNKYNVHPQICDAVSRDILDQILAADAAGEKSMVLYVPYNVADPYQGDNWPHTLILMPRVSGALYEHGMTRNYILIEEVIPSSEMNARHGLPMPE